MFDERGPRGRVVTSPGSAAAGRGRRCCCTAVRRRGEFWVTESRSSAATVPRSTRSASCPSTRPPRAQRREARELIGGYRASGVGRATPARLRVARASRPPAALAAALPRPRRGRAGRAAASPSKSSSLAARVAGRPGHGGEGRRLGRWRARRGGGPLALVVPFELTGTSGGHCGYRRRPGPGTPDATVADGRGGSGKTWLPGAMLRALENGAQAALMAPTETLATNYTAARFAPGRPLALELLTGSTARCAGASCRPPGHGRCSSW